MMRQTTLDDVQYVADNMRGPDAHEVKVITGLSPLEALMAGLMTSDFCRTAYDVRAVPVAILGISSVPGDHRGWVWMLSTPAISSQIRDVLEMGQGWLDLQHEKYPVLTNRMTASNTLHRKLARRLGFTEGPEYTFAGTKLIDIERKHRCAHQH